MLPTRLLWPPDFPNVVVHTIVARRDGHPGYARAKAGDPAAALTLAIGKRPPWTVVQKRPAGIRPFPGTHAGAAHAHGSSSSSRLIG